MKTFLASLAAMTLLLAVAPPAQADVGFESASRRVGSPGDRIELAIGCGFCFPRCVGEPGHLHAPGAPDGTCMPRKDEPPATFPVWITPRNHSLDPYTCDPGEYEQERAGGPCRSGSRPPHLPSFIYLGRAAPPRGSAAPADRPRHWFPRYRLIFGVPEADPGLYKYVLFCETCVDGPRGSLIDDRGRAAGPLRVLPSIAEASGGGGGALPWAGAGALAVLLAIGSLLLLRRGRTAGTNARRAA